MPLKRGCSPKTRQENIRREIRAGKEPRQAAAIAYDKQRKQGCDVPRPKHTAGHVARVGMATAGPCEWQRGEIVGEESHHILLKLEDGRVCRVDKKAAIYESSVPSPRHASGVHYTSANQFATAVVANLISLGLSFSEAERIVQARESWILRAHEATAPPRATAEALLPARSAKI